MPDAGDDRPSPQPEPSEPDEIALGDALEANPSASAGDDASAAGKAEAESSDAPADASVDARAGDSEGERDAGRDPGAGDDEDGVPAPVTAEEVARILEALLFVSAEPLKPDRLMDLMGLRSVIPIREAAATLAAHYDQSGRAFQLVEIGQGYQLLTRPALDPFIMRLRRTRAEQKLTPHALVTLAIVAYKQPITRAEIDAIRGVGSQHHVRNLMERNLVKVVGRKEAPGAPPQYGTTDAFLKQFGLKSVRDLPSEPDYGELADEATEAADEATNALGADEATEPRDQDLYARPGWIGRDEPGDDAPAEDAEAGSSLDAEAQKAKQAGSAASTADDADASEVPVKEIVPRTREVVEPDDA